MRLRPLLHLRQPPDHHLHLSLRLHRPQDLAQALVLAQALALALVPVLALALAPVLALVLALVPFGAASTSLFGLLLILTQISLRVKTCSCLTRFLGLPFNCSIIFTSGNV